MTDINEILRMNEDEFVNIILTDNKLIKNQEVTDKLLGLSAGKLNIFMSKATPDLLKNVIDENEALLKCDELSFRIFVKRIDYKLKERFLTDDKLLIRILKDKPTMPSSKLFNVYTIDDKIKILKKKELIDSIDKELFIKLVDEIEEKDFKLIAPHLPKHNSLKREEDLLVYVKSKYKIEEFDSNFLGFLKEKFKTNDSFIYYLRRIDTYEQLYLFVKYDVLLKFNMKDERIMFSDGVNISFELLKNVNRKQITTLYEKYIELDNINPDQIAFVNAVKMYMLLGFDGARRLASGDYSNMSEKALRRVGESLTAEKRKECRMMGQRKFYTIDFKRAVEINVQKNDISFIKDAFEISEEKAKQLIEEIKGNIENSERIIKENVEAREKRIADEKMKEFLIDHNHVLSKKNSVDNLTIYKLFKNLDIDYFELKDNGKSEPNLNLVNFLLGNLKKDNDCLMRIILNGYSYGIERTINTIIQKYELFKEMSEGSKGKISQYNLFDIIDLSKSIVYDLKPDEKDISYSNLVKLINSCEHITCSSRDEILKQALELHKLRHKKITSSIPIVSSENKDLKTRLLEFDSPDLITLGINSGSCLRVGALGEDFLRYIMTSPHAAVIEMKYDNQTYICPIVRNGNGIYANGVEPKIESELLRKKVMRSLEEFGKLMISNSNEDEKIEFFAISNLNQIESLPADGYYELDMDNYEQIEDTFHTDYIMKKDEIHRGNRRRMFVLAHNGTVKPEYYIPNQLFLKDVNPVFTYNGTGKISIDKVGFLINYVNYSSIDYRDISNQEKIQLKKDYSELNPRDFKMIKGSKDWFVALDHEGNKVFAALPHDKRTSAYFSFNKLAMGLSRNGGDNYDVEGKRR